MTPRVSIVTIFRDAGAFLAEAIASVQAQTMTDWELLLVDDGSTDRGTAIAQQAAQENPDRIRYLEHPGHVNRGKSVSLNLGIAAARAPFVAFLDADDVYLPEKLEFQLSLLEHHPDVGMVYGPMTYWWSWTGHASDVEKDHVRPLGVPTGVAIEPPDLFTAFIRRRASTPGTCSVLIRRDVFDRVGGFEEAVTIMHSDQVIFYKIAISENVLATDRPLDLYRQHPESTMVRLAADQRRRHRKFLAWLADYVAQPLPYGALLRREVRRARRSQSWPFRTTRRSRRFVRRTMRRLRRLA